MKDVVVKWIGCVGVIKFDKSESYNINFITIGQNFCRLEKKTLMGINGYLQLFVCRFNASIENNILKRILTSRNVLTVKYFVIV